MGEKSRHVHWALLIVALLTGTMLAGCGNSNKKSTKPASAPGAAVSVGVSACITCHSDVTSDWLASKHGNLENGDLYGTGNPTMAQIATGDCASCHDPLGDSQRLATGVMGNVARPVVGCESCHGGGSLHVSDGGPVGTTALASGVIGTVEVSAQFNTCTFCHELLDSAGTGTAAATHGPSSAVAPTGTQYAITDTHYALPGEWLPSPSNLSVHNSDTDYIAIFGYAMDFNDPKVCTNCHNPHRDATINREWSQSAHADRQGIKIDPRSGASVGTYSFSSAWAHYNWSARAECQRCHTTTGFTAYANALRSGDTTLAAEIRSGDVQSLPSNTFFKPEMLKCNGCHTDTKGSLRNPGAVTADYSLVSSGATLAVATHAYPDLGGSNVCMACHTGRQSGDTIKGINNPALLSAGTITSVDFSKRSFINSHYLTAGGTIFRTTGYTFAPRDYSNIGIYLHDKIGTAAAPDTGSNGPCVGCHMSRPNENGNHLFLPVARVASGETATITAITSEVCFKCHGPNDVLMLDLVNAQRTMYHEALEALKSYLEKRGYYFADASPYFYQLRDRQGTVSVTNGDPVVTLTGGSWVTSGVTGTTFPNSIQDRFRVNDDGQYYTIESVDDATHVTLQAPYTGPTNAAAEYTIIGSRTQSWLTTTTPYYPSATVDTDTTGSTTGKNNMGAAFNYNLLEHDPGAYAHNRYYVKRLIYDSLDWLDDNIMNYSVGTTLDAACSGGSAPAWCTGTTEYLLPNGVLGMAAERP